jgi:hypothetical protein
MEELDKQLNIDEHVLISFEMFLESLVSENPDYYSQLYSKYKSGELDKKLMLLSGITDMADLYNEFYDF